MFLKVKTVEREGSWYISEAGEKTINTNAIAVIGIDDRKSTFESKEVNVSRVRLIGGKEISVIGKFTYNNGEITGITEE